MLLIIAALLCCAILAYRLWRVEDRLDSLEQWAGEDVHSWLTVTLDDDDE